MLIAGNWKMNTDHAAAVALAKGVVEKVGDPGDVLVAVCPPFVNIAGVGEAIKGSKVALGAQNMHFEDSGAFTGEVSAPMLKALGCKYVIIGHSERREYFGETDEGVNKKVKKAIASGLVPIMCIGETLEQREAGQEKEVVGKQVKAGLEGVEIDDSSKLVLAYEPVWAIGTGRTATPEQAQEIHAFIRGLLVEQFGQDKAAKIHILYGGSMKPSNAAELLGKKDVDGGLIGGASLKADDFAALVEESKQS